jgi:hypothetical protein
MSNQKMSTISLQNDENQNQVNRTFAHCPFTFGNPYNKMSSTGAKFDRMISGSTADKSH